MVLGSAAVGAGNIATGLVGGLGGLLAARALVGVGSAASLAGTQAYMVDLTAHAPAHRARLLGTQQAVTGVAFVAGPAIGGVLAEVRDLRTA